MNTYKITQPLRVGGLASERHQDLSLSELNKRGFRVIGGDKGDLFFDGYSLDESVPMTELSSPVLSTALELSDAEAFDVALEILCESVDSVGLEAVEHS